MIRKIFLFDCKLYLRDVLIASGAIIILGLIPSLLIRFNAPGALISLSYTPWIFSLIGLAIYMFIIMYKMLYKSLFENEGYLTYSIPTRMVKILIAKILLSFIILTIISVAIILSIVIHVAVLIDGFGGLASLIEAIGGLFGVMDINAWLMLIFIISLLLISTLLSIVSFILASILVAMMRVKKFRLLVIFLIWQAVASMLSLVMLPIMLIGADANFLIITALNIILNTALIVGVTLLSAHMLERKIDLE